MSEQDEVYGMSTRRLMDLLETATSAHKVYNWGRRTAYTASVVEKIIPLLEEALAVSPDSALNQRGREIIEHARLEISRTGHDSSDDFYYPYDGSGYFRIPRP